MATVLAISAKAADLDRRGLSRRRSHGFLLRLGRLTNLVVEFGWLAKPTLALLTLLSR